MVQDKSQFEPWVSANVEKLLTHVEVEERDLVDDIDMFYPLDRKAAVGPLLISEESKEGEIPYADNSERQNQAIQAAMSAFEQKFGKFSDVMVARYQKKKEEKQLKKKLKEQDRQQQQMFVDPNAPPIDSFLIGGGFMEQGGGFGQQPSFGGQMQQRNAASKMAMADIDTKKPKVNVYV